MSEYDIFAIKTAGPLNRPGSMLMWAKDHDKTTAINYYIWYIKGTDEIIIVDAGITPSLATQKNLTEYENPVSSLSRLNIDSNDVKHLILTHLHFDHVSGVSLFPNATFYVQEEEFNFWVNDPIARRPPFDFLSDQSALDYLLSLSNTDRLVLLNGDREILPGIQCLLAPGHTPGLQAVAVDTRKGVAVLGSDCAHLFNNYKENWPGGIITDLRAWMHSFDKLNAHASSPDLLFPGHDPIMSDNYLEIVKNITWLV